MKILGWILGIIMLVPIAIILGITSAITLVGGWIWLLFKICGWGLIIILLIIVLVKIIKYFSNS